MCFCQNSKKRRTVDKEEFVDADFLPVLAMDLGEMQTRIGNSGDPISDRAIHDLKQAILY